MFESALHFAILYRAAFSIFSFLRMIFKFLISTDKKNILYFKSSFCFCYPLIPFICLLSCCFLSLFLYLLCTFYFRNQTDDGTLKECRSRVSKMTVSMCPSNIISELSTPYSKSNSYNNNITNRNSNNNNDNNNSNNYNNDNNNTNSDQKQRKESKEGKELKDNTESDKGGILDFLRLSLHLVPSQRLTAKEIFKLPLFKSTASLESVANTSSLTSQVEYPIYFQIYWKLFFNIWEIFLLFI